MSNIAIFEQKCEALGAEATEDQVERLMDWVRVNIEPHDLWVAKGIAASYEIPDMYTMISENQGEWGV